jgi:hypothetical protein
MIDPSHERRRLPTGRGFADAVTFAWADRRAEIYGFARLGVAEGHGSALAVIFAGREPVAGVDRSGLALDEDAGWEHLALGGIETAIEAPLALWTLTCRAGGAEVILEFAATGPPAEVGDRDPIARAGGMVGYEQPCRVRGRARVRDRAFEVSGVGQRGHQWGVPDWDRISLARTVTAWTRDGDGVALNAVRSKKSGDHGSEAVWAAIVGPEGTVAVDDPRLSTTYDADGRHRRAGIELWVREEDPFPQRASGEVLCGSSLELGELRLDCAFFEWRLEGRDAVGRYDILRRA